MHAVQQRKKSTPRSSMAECLALELLMAYKKEGSARQKRDDLHKLALEHKANVAGYKL
jgi:ribosomal protein S7